MTTLILEKKYEYEYRPYSQKELQTNRNKVFKHLRIGTLQARHKKCKHFYFVKENGRKEKEIHLRFFKKEIQLRFFNKEKENENEDEDENKDLDDIGNCSVCWKFNKTQKHLKVWAKNIINSYCNKFYIPTPYFTCENVDLEITFYTWLYEDIN